MPWEFELRSPGFGVSIPWQRSVPGGSGHHGNRGGRAPLNAIPSK